MEVMVQVVLFNVGRISLLLVTLGSYPRGHILERDVVRIAWAGVVVVFLVWAAIALYNNYG